MTKILFGGLFIYVSVLAALWLMRMSLIYPLDPTHVSPDRSRLPDITEKTLRTADGNDLVIWTAPARAGEPTVLYFPGNAGNLGDRTERFRRFRLQGIGLVAMAYRGSNGSTGKASEAAVTADARLLRDQMFDLLGTGANSAVIYYGESLGSAVAVKLATTHAPAGLILEAPFTSVPDVAAQAFPIFPARLILDERWASTEPKTRLCPMRRGWQCSMQRVSARSFSSPSRAEATTTCGPSTSRKPSSDFSTGSKSLAYPARIPAPAAR